MKPVQTTLLFCVPAALLNSTPALADHGAAANGPGTSGPIVGATAGTLAKGSVVVALEATISEPDNRDDTTLARLAGQHIHAHDQDSGQSYALGAAYGLTAGVTLSFALPFIRRVNIREGEHSHTGTGVVNNVVQRGDSAEVGDATLLAKWRFTGENHHGWEGAVIAGAKLPTGATHRIDDEGERFETEHQPGTGSLDPILGIALTRPLPHGGFHVSAVYQLSTKGSQDTSLGDRSQAAIGLTWRLFGDVIDVHARDHDHEAGDEAAHRRDAATLDGVIELNGEWEGRQREAGTLDRYSGGKALFLSPGLRFNAGQWSASLGGSVPLTQDIRLSHSNTSYRARLGIARSF